MRLLALTILALGAGSSSARAESPAIVKTGVPDVDGVFRETASATSLLDAADARMDEFLRQVATPLGLPADASVARSVWTIKERAAGDVRSLTADGRPVLMVGAGAPSEAKDAASALNEGTQELAVMAADLALLPDRLTAVAKKGEGITVDAALLTKAGLDAGRAGDVKSGVAANASATRAAAERARTVAARATSLIGQVSTGLAASAEPDVPAATVAPASAPAPSPAPRGPVATVGEVVQKAWTQFNDAELDAAVDLLAEADLLLPRQTKPVSRAELLDLFGVRALVNLVQGDATAATWSVTQVLVIHPGASPDSRLGPDYAKLHKAIAKAGVVRKVDVPVKGEGRAYLSGNEITGGSTLQLGQGQHLLQVEKNGTWVSSVVYVRDGFTVSF